MRSGDARERVVYMVYVGLMCLLKIGKGNEMCMAVQGPGSEIGQPHQLRIRFLKQKAPEASSISGLLQGLLRTLNLVLPVADSMSHTGAVLIILQNRLH